MENLEQDAFADAISMRYDDTRLGCYYFNFENTRDRDVWFRVGLSQRGRGIVICFVQHDIALMNWGFDSAWQSLVRYRINLPEKKKFESFTLFRYPEDNHYEIKGQDEERNYTFIIAFDEDGTPRK